MPDAYIIEVNDKVAGIVARDGHSYQFFASDKVFFALEATRFSSVSRAQAAAQRFYQSLTQRPGAAA